MKEIVQQIHLSAYTVKSHVHNIMEKLALHARLEGANFAYIDGTLMKEIAKSISMIHN